MQMVNVRMGSRDSDDRRPPAPVVETTHGAVRGKTLRLSSGARVHAFMGIPYSKPPIGELRFRKPVPLEPWPDVLNCCRFRHRAVQKEFIWDKIGVGVSEDALHLNICSPDQPDQEFQAGYPVFIYIHGGGYQMDSASKYKFRQIAKNLVVHKVIVVTIQYRLGFLGFLSLDDQHAKGNYGIHDQIAALRWIKANIARFGGDPENITVSGHSAGGCSADLLALSPVSRDLFKQTILMGGFADDSWALTQKRLIVEFCREKALALGFRRLSSDVEWSDEESLACVDFLRSLPASCFSMSMIGDTYVMREMRLNMSPVYDDELFPRPLAQLRQEAAPKVTMAGVTQFEGLLFLALGRKRANYKLVEYCVSRVGDMLTAVAARRGVENTMTLDEYRALYNIDESTCKSKKATQRVCVDIMGDLINNVALHSYCKRITERGGTCYRYTFEHYNTMLTSSINLFLPFVGAMHGTETAYLFDCNVFVTPYPKTRTDRKITKLTGKLWTNFVKYGNPNGRGPSSEFEFTWKPLTRDNLSQQLAIRSPAEFRENVDVRRLNMLLPMLDAINEQISL